MGAKCQLKNQVQVLLHDTMIIFCKLVMLIHTLKNGTMEFCYTFMANNGSNTEFCMNLNQQIIYRHMYYKPG